MWIRRAGQVKALARTVPTEKVVDEKVGPKRAVHRRAYTHEGAAADILDDFGLCAEIGDVFGFPIATLEGRRTAFAGGDVRASQESAQEAVVG
jgi:hypothetical protein